MYTLNSTHLIKRHVGTVFTTIALTITSLPYAQAESWELRTATQEVKGTRALEAGQLDKAIRVMEANYGTTPYVQKGAMLTNLCVAYILKRDLPGARNYCDRAVEHGFNDRTAHNNRGVLSTLQGDYRAAISDFEKAGCLATCPDSLDNRGNDSMDVAQRNLQRAQVNYARQEGKEVQFVERVEP